MTTCTIFLLLGYSLMKGQIDDYVSTSSIIPGKILKVRMRAFCSHPESIATLPPFGAIEGHKFFQISSLWESQKNWFASISFRLWAKSSFYLPVFEISRLCRTVSELWKSARHTDELIFRTAQNAYFVPNSGWIQIFCCHLSPATEFRNKYSVFFLVFS